MLYREERRRREAASAKICAMGGAAAARCRYAVCYIRDMARAASFVALSKRRYMIRVMLYVACVILPPAPHACQPLVRQEVSAHTPPSSRRYMLHI